MKGARQCNSIFVSSIYKEELKKKKKKKGTYDCLETRKYFLLSSTAHVGENAHTSDISLCDIDFSHPHFASEPRVILI